MHTVSSRRYRRVSTLALALASIAACPKDDAGDRARQNVGSDWFQIVEVDLRPAEECAKPMSDRSGNVFYACGEPLVDAADIVSCAPYDSPAGWGVEARLAKPAANRLEQRIRGVKGDQGLLFACAVNGVIFYAGRAHVPPDVRITLDAFRKRAEAFELARDLKRGYPAESPSYIATPGSTGNNASFFRVFRLSATRTAKCAQALKDREGTIYYTCGDPGLDLDDIVLSSGSINQLEGAWHVTLEIRPASRLLVGEWFRKHENEPGGYVVDGVVVQTVRFGHELLPRLTIGPFSGKAPAEEFNEAVKRGGAKTAFKEVIRRLEAGDLDDKDMRRLTVAALRDHGRKERPIGPLEVRILNLLRNADQLSPLQTRCFFERLIDCELSAAGAVSVDDPVPVQIRITAHGDWRECSLWCTVTILPNLASDGDDVLHFPVAWSVPKGRLAAR